MVFLRRENQSMAWTDGTRAVNYTRLLKLDFKKARINNVYTRNCAFGTKDKIFMNIKHFGNKSLIKKIVYLVLHR